VFWIYHNLTQVYGLEIPLPYTFPHSYLLCLVNYNLKLTEALPNSYYRKALRSPNDLGQHEARNLHLTLIT